MRRLRVIVVAEYPHEAVGLLINDDEIITLPNRAESPEDSFKITKEDVIEALDGRYQFEDITLWHSHPGGGVGPSRTDMQQKTAFPNHLVLSLVDSDIVATWY